MKKIMVIFFLIISNTCWTMEESDRGEFDEPLEQFKQVWDKKIDTSLILEAINTLKKNYEKEGPLTESDKKKIPVIIIFNDKNKKWYPFSIIEKAKTLKDLTDDSGLTLDLTSQGITQEILDMIFDYLQELDASSDTDLASITKKHFKMEDFSICMHFLNIINHLNVNSKSFSSQAIIATLFKSLSLNSQNLFKKI